MVVSLYGFCTQATRTFTANWTGTGSIISSGDNELIKLDTGEYMESEVINVGVGQMAIKLAEYQSGTGIPVIKYKDGNSVANCEADTWHTYSVPYSSLGYSKIRLEK